MIKRRIASLSYPTLPRSPPCLLASVEDQLTLTTLNPSFTIPPYLVGRLGPQPKVPLSILPYLVGSLGPELVYPVVSDPVAELLLLPVQDVLRQVLVLRRVERLSHDVLLDLALSSASTRERVCVFSN